MTLDVNAYHAFIAGKRAKAKLEGMAVPSLAPHLFAFQRQCTAFALASGRSGLFLDTGLGKTEIQLDWCQKVAGETGKPSLILTPLAVAGQTQRRAERWGYEAAVIRDRASTLAPISICNYDRIDKLDPDVFGGVALDEASLLKGASGKIRERLTEMFAGHRFKLTATATPAPNDHIELTSYADFLGIMPAREMVTRFFHHDQAAAISPSRRWRIKEHAREAFWDFMTGFCRMAQVPSDLTGNPADDNAFTLQPFDIVRHHAENTKVNAVLLDLFGVKLSATTLHDIKRNTIGERAKTAAAIVAAEPDRPWILWVDTDYEADALMRVLPQALEVRGSHATDTKERRLLAFEKNGGVFIGKPAMCGVGLDWSFCDRMIFVGRSYSYQTWYQAVRRCWRFGQKNKVVVHLVIAEGEDEIGRMLDVKASGHEEMREEMRAAMRRAGHGEAISVIQEDRDIERLPTWLTPSIMV